MTPRPSRFKKAVHTLRRRLVAEATLATFAEKGCFSTSVKEIAERAGVATGSVYAHHASKNELLKDAMVAAVEEAERRWSGLGSAAGVRASLTHLTDSFLSILEEGDLLIPLIDGRLACYLRWSGADDRPNEWLEELIASFLTRAEAQGEIRCGTDKRLAAQLFLLIFSSRRVKERLGNGGRAGLAEELVAYIFDGLRLV